MFNAQALRQIASQPWPSEDLPLLKSGKSRWLGRIVSKEAETTPLQVVTEIQDVITKKPETLASREVIDDLFTVSEQLRTLAGLHGEATTLSTLVTQATPVEHVDSVQLKEGVEVLTIPRKLLLLKGDYFCKLAGGSFKEKVEKTIVLEEDSPSAAQLLFEFLRTGQVRYTVENVPEVYKIASKYQLNVLTQ